MLLDKVLFEQLGPVGKSLIKKAGLVDYPKSVDEMAKFLNTVKSSIENESFDGLIVGNVFFNFASSLEVRDRHTTSRIFEDIFSNLFGLEATDCSVRSNPAPNDDLLNLDSLCVNVNWRISEDVSGNRREKSDVHLGDYDISLKTLKGMAYGETGNIIDRGMNKEVNVGSFSYRALFINILPNDLVLTDRMGGLGSGAQMRTKVLDVIKANNKQEEFLKRLKIFVNFIYDDDIYLVLKSNYKIIFYLIPKKSFTECILQLYEKKEEEFENVWYRWENNNLRFNWPNMLQYMTEFELKYHIVDIPLTKAVQSQQIKAFTDKIKNAVDEYISNLELRG